MKLIVCIVVLAAVALCSAADPSGIPPPPSTPPTAGDRASSSGHLNPFTNADDQLNWKHWPYCVAVPPENNEFLDEVENAEFVIGRNDGVTSVALQFAQALLNTEKSTLKVTGQWDAESTAALQQVQKIRGLADDGLLTPDMWQFLFGRGIFTGDQGYQAYAVWALLRDFYGYPMSEPYAGYDDKMVDAVADFQLKMGLVELCCSERHNNHECHEFSEGFKAGHLIGPRFLEMLTLSVTKKQQGDSLLKSLEDKNVRSAVNALAADDGTLKTACETIHNVRVAALQRIVADSLRGSNDVHASGVASVGVQAAALRNDLFAPSGSVLNDIRGIAGEQIDTSEFDSSSILNGADLESTIEESSRTNALPADGMSLLQEASQAVSCTYNDARGSCLTKTQCDALPGAHQTVSLFSSKQGAKGCEKEPSAVKCCILQTKRATLDPVENDRWHTVAHPEVDDRWHTAVDPRTNRPYYYNLALGVSQWENPEEQATAEAAQVAGTTTTQTQNNWMTTVTPAGNDAGSDVNTVGEEEPETEPETEPTTEPETEPTTEPTTEPETEPTTEPTTDTKWPAFPENTACSFHEEKGVCMKTSDCSDLSTAGHPFMSVKSRLGAKGCETKPNGVRCCVRNMGKYALLNEWDERQSTTVQTPWFGLPEPTHLQKRTTMKLWATTYYTPIVEHKAKGGVAIKDVNQKALGASVDKKMFCLGCSLQGSCVVKKGSTLTTYSYVKAGTEQLASCCDYFKPSCSKSGKATFHESSSAYGSTSRGLNVTPLRTIAVDPKYIPYYSVVYIPAARGEKAKLFDGTEITHDGYFYAVDTGGAIHDDHIDVYYGPSDKSIKAPFDFIKSKDLGAKNFDAYIIDSVEAFVLLDDTHRAT